MCALPICRARGDDGAASDRNPAALCPDQLRRPGGRRLLGGHARAAPVEIEPVRRCGRIERHGLRHRGALRSEEHTSELQSLMRISYAVFCLKKKKKTNLPTPTHD